MNVLEKPVEILFMEDSIPGLRRGVLTTESKAEIKSSILELLKDSKTKREFREKVEAL